MSGIQNVLWRHSIWKTMFLKRMYKQEKLPKLGFFREKKKKASLSIHMARTLIGCPLRKIKEFKLKMEHLLQA